MRTYKEIVKNYILIYNKIGDIPHKTEIVVIEQNLTHEGWGSYSGYLYVKRMDDEETFYINVSNFITNPYWNYDVSRAASVGNFVAEFNQISDFYPVSSRGDKIELTDGIKVLVTGQKSDKKNNTIEAVVFKEWKNGYGGVDVYFNSQDLTLVY